MTPRSPRHHPSPQDVLEITGLKKTFLRAGRLFVEAMLVPTVLLAVLLHLVGVVPSILAAVGWCVLATGFRWFVDRELPGTLMLGSCLLIARAAVAIASGSAFVYLLQPALGSIVMALLFVGSAFVGRPITLRLARDFLTLPAHITDRRGVRRMFSEVAVIWGVSRLLDAGMNISLLHLSVDDGLLARGVFSPVLTGLAIATCTFWGWRCLRKNGISLRFTAAPAAEAAPAAP